MDQKIRFAVYEHRLVDSSGNIIRRNFIVLKDEDGDVVLWTDFHRMRRVGERLWYAASTVMMKNDSGALPNSLITCFLIVIISPCNLRRASATDALTSGRLAEQNGRPPDNPNSVLQLDHHDIMLGDPLEDCVSRYCIVHDHGLPFVWFPLGTDDCAP